MPVELAADPDAELDLPAFEIVDRFADSAPSEPDWTHEDTDLTPVEDELAEDYSDDDTSEDAEPETDPEDASEPASAEEASRAILAALELTDDEDDADEASADFEAEVEAEDDADAADAEAEEADEEAESDEGDADDQPVGVRPLALDKPVANAPDDLTVIGGIGPKIQEVLNGMGIWHYDQIAAWTPENVAWVDQELNFSGRIVREGWVQQAAVLVGDTIDEDAF